jgi:hypothetical protein
MASWTALRFPDEVASKIFMAFVQDGVKKKD